MPEPVVRGLTVAPDGRGVLQTELAPAIEQNGVDHLSFDADLKIVIVEFEGVPDDA